MKVGMVSTIVMIEMGCPSCGGSCITDAGSYLITKEEKVVSCEVCYAQYQVTEDHFLVIPQQLEEIRAGLRGISLVFAGSTWKDLSREQLLIGLRKIYQIITRLTTLVEKAS